MFNKIKAIKDLRQQAKKMQNALAEIIEIGDAASGGVRVAMDGNQQVQRVEISDELCQRKDRLESAVKDAVNDAVKKVQGQMGKKMKEMGGLDALKNFNL